MNKYDRYRLKDVEAYRKRKREWASTPEQRQKRTTYMRLWREKNRQHNNELCLKSHHKNKHKHIDKRRDDHLRRTFGITLAQKTDMVISQQNQCKICFEPFQSTRSTHVDHDHRTGKIRGILCHACNTKLGWYEQNKESIKNYLGD